MNERKDLKAAYEELLYDYNTARESLIFEYSSTIRADLKELQAECNELSWKWLGKPFSSEREISGST